MITILQDKRSLTDLVGDDKIVNDAQNWPPMENFMLVYYISELDIIK